MFQLLYDARHKVLMTRLHGSYAERDIVLRDKAVVRFVAQHGLVRGIMDFTGVQEVEVSMDVIVRRCEGPPLLPGQARVLVAPHDPAYGLNRVIAAHQFYRRGVEPLLVRTLEDAYLALAIENPDFRPLDVGPESRLESFAHDMLTALETRYAPPPDEEYERMRRNMLRLLDNALSRAPATRSKAAITLGDVLNTAMTAARVNDTDLQVACPSCNERRPLSQYRLSSGRETTYACRSCGQAALTLTPSEHCDRSDPGYVIGRFVVHTASDIEYPGGVLPKCEP
ncbi:hypothetical protein [Reyranella sp.]|uniref:hypothetical protein n=1 Tax=Reyranella sp. TaxID=1929291 RepID=UPI003BAA5D13